MTRKKRVAGKRLASGSYTKNRRTYQAYSRVQSGNARAEKGKREETPSPNGSRQLRQLVVSAIILVSVVAVKLLAPQSLEPIRGQMLQLMGMQSDFTEVFSSVGRAVNGEDGVREVLNDAYVAVFGTNEIADGGNSAETPTDAYMMQQVLGFAYAAPVDGSINDTFGLREHPTEGIEKFHYGLDIEADSGTVIRSFADGSVTAVGESSSLGKYVTVLHENGYSTLYAHCSRITASSGQRVRLGDPIAEVGKTGQATGAHLHFELCKNTLYLNPIYYVA